MPYKGGIVMGASFYIDDNKNVKCDVKLMYKGKPKQLTLDVSQHNNLIIEQVIQSIYKDNFGS